MTIQTVKARRNPFLKLIKRDRHSDPVKEHATLLLSSNKDLHKQEIVDALECKKALEEQIKALSQSLSDARQMLVDQSNEFDATTELLRLNLSKAQEELRVMRLDRQQHAEELIDEKGKLVKRFTALQDDLLQQIDHLQERLEH